MSNSRLLNNRGYPPTDSPTPAIHRTATSPISSPTIVTDPPLPSPGRVPDETQERLLGNSSQFVTRQLDSADRVGVALAPPPSGQPEGALGGRTK